MKLTNSSSLALVLCLASIPLQSAIADSFDLSKMRGDNNGQMIIPGSNGAYLRLEDAAIVVEADAETGQSVLAFHGTQAKPAVINFKEVPTSVRVKVKIKPTHGTGNIQETIIMHPGNFELRFNPQRKELSLLVNSTGGVSQSPLSLAVKPGQWNTVEILIKEQKYQLVVNGIESLGALPPQSTMAGAKSFLRIGSTADGNRPFSGYLMDITISEPAD